MMSGLRKRTKNAGERALDEASEWKSILERGQESDHAVFAAWLEKDARNVRAFLLVSGFDPVLGPFLRRQFPDAEPVVHLHSARATPAARWLPLAAVAASVCVLASAAVWYRFASDLAPEAREYQTRIGEHRVITLADGSTVHLNTQSRLESRYTRGARDLDLASGEAFFIVAHDSRRPFRVHTSAATVQAIGTRFNVDTHGPRMVVSVLEGKVQLALADASSGDELTRFTPLIAGQSMEIQRVQRSADLHVTTLTSEALERRVAWMSGLLTFDHETVLNVVAEMNRYNRQQIVISDPQIEGVQVGGQFKATDPRTFLRGLQYSMNAEVDWPAPPNAGTAPIRLSGPKPASHAEPAARNRK
ncbi:MAG: FecR domain-containing protein [Gammaproteobacteria bacterium]